MTESIELAPARLSVLPDVGRFERLPKWLNLVPTVIHWMALGLRYRSLSLPTALNVGITSGGMVGDGKLEYFGAMGPIARAATAAYVGVTIQADTGLDTLLAAMRQNNLGFPVIAKPDLGWCGLGVRRVDDAGELAAYLAHFPRGATLLLQAYVDAPGEAGLFYMREPGQKHGRVHALLLRHLPCVIGNGRDTMATLVRRQRRLRRTVAQRHHECRYDPAYIPAAGERVALSTVASTRVGGGYEDGSAWITPQLTRCVDNMLGDMVLGHTDGFCFGRLDVRYRDLDALRRGCFTILEINGAGADAVHAWDPRYGMTEAFRILFHKQRELFRLADLARRRGAKPLGIVRLARLHWRQLRLMRLYPPSN